MRPICRLHRGVTEGDYTCRYFEIGLARTASRSVCMAARMLGLHAKHGTDYCRACGRDMVAKFLEGSIEYDIYETCEYSGNIASLHWSRLALARPDAQFVLPYRPLDSWMESTMKRVGKSRRYCKACLKSPVAYTHLYHLRHYGQIVITEEVVKEGYLRHVEAVMKSDLLKDRLCVLNVFEESADETWRKLARFLGKKPPAAGTPFPRQDRERRLPLLKTPEG